MFFFTPIGLVQPIVMLLGKLMEDYIGLYMTFEKKILRNAYCPTRQMRFFKYLIFEIGNKCGIIGRQKREKMFNIRERIKHNNGKVF